LWVEEVRAGGEKTPFRFTGKRLDEETGLYYYGARYLDPQTSRWLSTDPAMGEYIPAPGQGADKLPGMGGVFNTVNLHVYHYAGNNPVKYTDPTGRKIAVIPIFRQSDTRYSDMHLGGMRTYDKYDAATGRYALNTIGAFGCKYMAAVSIGAALFSKDSSVYMSDRENFARYFNLGEFFLDPVKNGAGGVDINMTDEQFVGLVSQISGKKLHNEVFTEGQGSISDKLQDLEKSETTYYVVAQFSKTGVTDSHFNVLDGITVDEKGNVSRLLYMEQYDGIKSGKFDVTDIKKLIIIWE
jgi:RHS repeat-associated protein